MVDKGLVGRTGISMDSIYDMEIAFEDIPLDKVSAALQDPNPHTMEAFYFALPQKRGIPLKKLDGTTKADVYHIWLPVKC